ncbi:hypothetical protein [Solitalea lacus]|uniref:hypothetical protein n=1 Tax=Solitalea lacus TaxID=2911172 RepID=UPI001EDA3658|nr:hypothetical protein [Solitalea lacus]UKJ06107.1 hypothetical protein L2B55_11170 [Solitalea lacus]
MQLENIVTKITQQPEIHAKWLNTLSMMENTGARKISACEHKKNVNLIILKHAAEEARHAYYLKKQIGKIDATLCPDYNNEHLLAPKASYAYLNSLDIEVCRYLKNELGLNGEELKFAAYLLVTYAIEVRADEIYPIYQDVLDSIGSKVNVKSIILEEEGHLEEMINQLKQFSSNWEMHGQKAISIESNLYQNWLIELDKELV